MEVKRNYNCGKKEAYKRVDTLLTELQDKYGDMIGNPTKSWNSSNDKMDFSFNAKGFTIIGNVVLTDNQLILDGKLPWLARPFSGKIETAIKGELEKLFS